MFHSSQNELQAGIRSSVEKQTKVHLLSLDPEHRPSIAQEVAAWRADAALLCLEYNSGADRETERARLARLLSLEAGLLSSSGEVAIAAVLELFAEPSWSKLTVGHSALRVGVAAAPTLLLINTASAEQVRVLHVAIEIIQEVHVHVDRTPHCVPLHGRLPYLSLGLSSLGLVALIVALCK